MKTLINGCLHEYEQKNYSKVIDTIYSKKKSDWNDEAKFLLAHSYIQIGKSEKAIDLLKYEMKGKENDAMWNYTMALAYQSLAYDNLFLDLKNTNFQAYPIFQHYIENARHFADIAFKLRPFYAPIFSLKKILEQDVQSVNIYLN